jgi:hypothetical protein
MSEDKNIKQQYLDFDEYIRHANYRNVQKGINAEPIFLIRFFRNLLLGETKELKNRYMIVNPPEEWKDPTSPPTSPPTSYPNKHPNKLPEQAPEQVQDLLLTIKGQMLYQELTNH